MNEFEKDRSTSEQLVELLDNEQDITICSDVVHGLYHEYKHLQEENQELKKQLENCWCNRTDCSARIKDSKQYNSLVQRVENQQKEFIEYLEKEIVDSKDGSGQQYFAQQHLRLYKEIIGEKDE